MIVKKLVLNLLKSFGYVVHRVPRPQPPQALVHPKYDKIHYASGRVYLDGWLNTDIIAQGPDNYMYVNLVGRHPFPDNFFRLAFSEDFIEHIDQAASLRFLVEAHRTLKPGGVLWLTTPDLEKVLVKHYRKNSFDSFEVGEREAFTSLGHVHFYSRETLKMVADHVGFDVIFIEDGKSSHPELQNISTRLDVVYLYAELTKRA